VAVTIPATNAQLDADRSVYDGHVQAGTRLVMLSSAVYPAYDPGHPAVASRHIIDRLRATGFTGVTISDDLTSGALRADGPAIATMATAAGADVLLYAATDGRDGYGRLLADVRAGRITRQALNVQVRRIIALKRWLASRD
jgi:beta-N-acetylhexosaminidase